MDDKPVILEEDQSNADTVARWINEINLYENQTSSWVDKGRRIIRRYRDERTSLTENQTRFNILWSNVQILAPAVFSQPPKPDISRRFKDKDDLGRIAADVLERVTSYFVSDESFAEVVRQAVLDRLLPGRGSVRVRYVPHFKKSELEDEQVTDDVDIASDDDTDEPLEEVTHEEVVFEYTNWQDYGHTVARTYREVCGEWFKVYMGEDQLKKRFPDIYKEIPLDYQPKGKNGETIADSLKKACIYEIWDKDNDKVLWISKGYTIAPLDERDDPLEIQGFFSSPRPLLATTANDTLIPTPDYEEYRDQANEIDNITARINALQKAVKVAGVYDASAQGITQLLSDGADNLLVPVDNWAMFAQQGGLDGAVSFMPLQDIVAALASLFDTRERIKNDIYELTGISDILRGATAAQETATAQQIKSNYANIRLSQMQGEIARFCRDLVAITAQIIAGQFGVETIKKISGVKLPTKEEKDHIIAMMQQKQMQAQQSGQPMESPPPEITELLQGPTWDEVMDLFHDEAALSFRVDIETDSTIKADEQQDKQDRQEFIAAMGSYFQQALPIIQQIPQAAPVLGELLLFGVRGFKVARGLEGAVETFVEQMTEHAENPPPPPQDGKTAPDPQVEAQKHAAEQQTSIQTATINAQAQQAIAANRANVEAQTEANKANIQADLDFRKHLADKDAEVKSETIKQNAAINIAQIYAAAGIREKVVEGHASIINTGQQTALTEQD